MELPDNETELAAAADQGDPLALDRLLSRHRARLRRAVGLRMSTALALRVDPSDIVQETMIVATHRITEFLQAAPMGFYPWLRRLATNQLSRAYRDHVLVQRRSVSREVSMDGDLSDVSWGMLSDRLPSAVSGPLSGLVRQESHRLIRAAMVQLAPLDREVVVLRFVEQLSTVEAAQVLGIEVPALRMRQLRAIQRLRTHLGT